MGVQSEIGELSVDTKQFRASTTTTSAPLSSNLREQQKREKRAETENDGHLSRTLDDGC